MSCFKWYHLFYVIFLIVGKECSLNDHVEKFQSMNENQVVVKGVVKMDERAELILAYLFLFMSNERKKIHIEWNGKIEITSTFDG